MPESTQFTDAYMRHGAYVDNNSVKYLHSYHRISWMNYFIGAVSLKVKLWTVIAQINDDYLNELYSMASLRGKCHWSQ